MNRYEHRRSSDQIPLIDSLYVLIVQCLLFIGLTLVSHCAHPGADTTDVIILKSGQAQVYDEVIQQIEQQLNRRCSSAAAPCPVLRLSIIDAEELNRDIAQHALVVTLGLLAKQTAEKYNDQNLTINAMIPLGHLTESPPLPTSHRHPTIVLDQPLERSLLLIKHLIPNATRVGFMFSRENLSIAESLAQKAEAQGLHLVSVIIENESQVGKKLSHILGKIDVLLALPDITIHNRKNVTNILLSSYRRKIPLVGYSSAYVKAGALAAIYSTPEDIGNQIAELIVKYTEDQPPAPDVFYPKYFSVSINSRVARSLSIQVPEDADSIETLIKDAEK